MNPPLYQQALALSAVLCDELANTGELPRLRDRLLTTSFRLFDLCALVVAGIDRPARLHDADAALCVLRAELDLARLVGLISDELHLALAEHTEGIGRQLGGWLRALQRAGVDRTAPPVRHPPSAPNSPKAAQPGDDTPPNSTPRPDA